MLLVYKAKSSKSKARVFIPSMKPNTNAGTQLFLVSYPILSFCSPSPFSPARDRRGDSNDGTPKHPRSDVVRSATITNGLSAYKADLCSSTARQVLDHRALGMTPPTGSLLPKSCPMATVPDLGLLTNSFTSCRYTSLVGGQT